MVRARNVATLGVAAVLGLAGITGTLTNQSAMASNAGNWEASVLGKPGMCAEMVTHGGEEKKLYYVAYELNGMLDDDNEATDGDATYSNLLRIAGDIHYAEDPVVKGVSSEYERALANLKSDLKSYLPDFETWDDLEGDDLIAKAKTHDGVKKAYDYVEAREALYTACFETMSAENSGLGVLRPYTIKEGKELANVAIEKAKAFDSNVNDFELLTIEDGDDTEKMASDSGAAVDGIGGSAEADGMGSIGGVGIGGNYTDLRAVLVATIEKVRAEEVYQKYDRLYVAVSHAESRVEGWGQTAAISMTDGSVARESLGYDQALIFEIGEALRALGSDTTLGQTLPETVAKADLEAAIKEAKGLQGYAEFEDLLNAIFEAEQALLNGITDETVLKSLIERINGHHLAIIKIFKEKVPDTGVLARATSASRTVSVLAGVATAVTTAGMAVIAKRRLAIKAQK